MTTGVSERINGLRAIMDDEMIATDPEELARALRDYLSDPVVASVIAGAYVNRVRRLVHAQGDIEQLQERMQEALNKVEGFETKLRKMRRENPKPLAIFLTITRPGHALVAVRGGVEPVEVTPEFARQAPPPGTFCLIDDEGFLSESSRLRVSQAPGVVRSLENGDVGVEVNGREVSASVSAALDGPLCVGDKVQVLEAAGMAMVTGRRAKSSEIALGRYPRIEPWPGGFAGAAPLREDLRDAAMRRIVFPVKYPELAKQLGLFLPALVLLCGPSRTGKTVCIRALAAELDVPAFAVSISSVGSEFVSVTPRLLREAVEAAKRLSATIKQPVLLVLDDGEQLARQRGSLPNSSGWHDDIVSELLGIVDYLEQDPGKVCVTMISNREDLIDTAFVKRAGQQLRFSLPGPVEYAAVWRFELGRLEKGVRPAEADEAIESLTAEVFTDSAWVGEMLGESALQLITPARLIDCAVPRLALAEARGLALERAVRDGHTAPMDPQLLRACQRKILVDGYRQAIKRAAGGRLSDLDLRALQPRP